MFTEEFLKSFLDGINTVSGWVWGLPLIILLGVVGLGFTIFLRALPFRKLFHALHLAFIKRNEKGAHPGDITHFQALMTALSATVGTGNIAGVASAIAVGGPGALFWMWVTGLLGMATKFAEALLAVKYRVVDKNNQMSGGPMYYIEKGLGMKWLAVAFAVFASIAAFGIGNAVQTNSVAEAMHSAFSIPRWVTGLAFMAGSALVVLGGIKSIAKVTSIIVPFMILFYVGTALVIVFMSLDKIPGILSDVFYYAFTPHAAIGGAVGALISKTVQTGVARGIFSNESGLGSSPIAAAAAKTDEPVHQALVSMTQTFIDTIIVCTLTGLVILAAGQWMNGVKGSELTAMSFQSLLPNGNYAVAISLVFFAFSTVLGWCYYGEKAVEYLFGEKVIKPYRYVFIAFTGIGAVGSLDIVWGISDIFNGLMAFPNLIALILLGPIVIKEANRYFSK
ncbi:MAG: sodium:alanine symporter family protein [Leptospirales bacterium]